MSQTDFERELKSLILLPWRKPDPFRPPENQVKAAFADKYLNHMEKLDIKSPSTVTNLTNIMATVGNKNNDMEHIRELLKTGINIIRIPTHSTKLYELESIVFNVKKVIEKTSMDDQKMNTAAVVMETQGAQIRTGKLARPSNVDTKDTEYAVELKKGSKIVLTHDSLFEDKSSGKRVFITSDDLVKRVILDDIIYLGIKDIHLKVTEKKDDAIYCIVIKEGKLRDHMLVTALGVILNLPVLSERDRHVVNLVLNDNLDMVILSTLRNADTIREVRAILQEGAEKVLILAKIETLPSFEHVDDIIKEADGVLLDRAHLSVATSNDVTFLAQKIIAARCQLQGKPFLIQGQILPDYNLSSYAEVNPGDMNDVYSMVQDGADVLVLGQSEKKFPIEVVSGDSQNLVHPSDVNACSDPETMSKSQPLKEQAQESDIKEISKSKTIEKQNIENRVEILKKILKKAESILWAQQIYNDLTDLAFPPLDPAHGIAIACVNMSLKCQASAIIVVTCSGYSAKLIARYRPQCPILAVSSVGYVCRHLNLYRNIKPLHYIRKPQSDWAKDVDCRIQFAIQHGMEADVINPGDPLVLVNGWRRGAGFTNIMRVVYAPIENIQS